MAESTNRALMQACETGDEAGVIAALEAGADVEASDERPPYAGKTPLMLAARCGFERILARLIHAGARLDRHDASGAAENRPIRWVLENGGYDGLFSDFSQLGRTALMEAAEHDRDDAVRLLLDAGADIEAGDLIGWTALHVAAYHGSIRSARALIDAGASSGVQDLVGATPLLLAVETRRYGVAKALIPAGSLDVPDKSGDTPLLLACQDTSKHRVELVRRLLEAGAEVPEYRLPIQDPTIRALIEEQQDERPSVDDLKARLKAKAKARKASRKKSADA